MSAVCWECVEDVYLKEKVKKTGKGADCSICGRRRKSFSAEDLAALIDPILRERVTPGESFKRFGPDDDDWWDQEGDALDHHVQEIIGQYLGFEEEIIDALEDQDPAQPQDGEAPFYDSSQSYVSVQIGPLAYQSEWDDLSHALKHQTRFFNRSALSFFGRLFEDLEKLTIWNEESGSEEALSYELPQGSTLFRARICRSDSNIKAAFEDPFKNIGPPPRELARAGRMNAEGIVVFYGALDSETCLAETRPAIGDQVGIMELSTTRPLRLLDFGRVEEAYGRPSYFQSNFDEMAERNEFLRRLETLISKPIVPGREFDYLITQTLAEYLTRVRSPRFDGMVFKSAQRSGGKNVAIFPDQEDSFAMRYVADTFNLRSVTSVEYKHGHIHVTKHDGEVYISDYNALDDDD